MMRQTPEHSILGGQTRGFPQDDRKREGDAVLDEAIAIVVSGIESVFKGSADKFEASPKATAKPEKETVS